jgi:hypothetical protein
MAKDRVVDQDHRRQTRHPRMIKKEVVRRYHGTSSNKASKIVQGGFKPGPDGVVFFAEDAQTAEFFAVTTKTPPGSDVPRSFTVIEFTIPRNLAEDLGLLNRTLIGSYRDAPMIQPGVSPYEVILYEADIHAFNQALDDGLIIARRLRLR